MAAFADLERLLERVFERTTARLFRARPQVVQVEHRIERAMERSRVQQGTRTVVPGRYRVRLNPGDLAILASDAGGPDVLAGRLADATLGFARTHGYHVSSRPSVAIIADPAVEKAEIEVDPVADRSAPEPVGQPVGAPSGQAGHNVPDTPVVAASAAQGPSTPAVGTADPAPGSGGHGAVDLVASAGLPAPATAPETREGSSIRREATETLVFRRPVPQEARAVLRVTAAGGSERLVEVGGAPVTIGRSTDNAIVLADARVSRHHGRLQARRGALVYTDLGSTNGSRVNGIRVDECALGIGDRIVLGDAVLLVEQLPG